MPASYHSYLVERQWFFNNLLGEILRSELKMSWKDTSSKRYANGIRRYYEWASAKPQVIAD
jgi:hypothetical protein